MRNRYEEGVYYAFVTMTTIGFGDFYPNKGGTDYHETGDITVHPVSVWLRWAAWLQVGVALLALVYDAAEEVWKRGKEEMIVRARTAEQERSQL